MLRRILTSCAVQVEIYCKKGVTHVKIYVIQYEYELQNKKML